MPKRPELMMPLTVMLSPFVVVESIEMISLGAEAFMVMTARLTTNLGIWKCRVMVVELLARKPVLVRTSFSLMTSSRTLTTHVSRTRSMVTSVTLVIMLQTETRVLLHLWVVGSSLLTETKITTFVILVST